MQQDLPLRHCIRALRQGSLGAPSEVPWRSNGSLTGLAWMGVREDISVPLQVLNPESIWKLVFFPPKGISVSLLSCLKINMSFLTMIVKTSTSVVLSKFFDVALYAHVNIIFTTQMLPKTSLDLDRPHMD